MKLPNGDRAIIDEDKLLNYLLDPLHREGRHHAELFRRLLDIDRNSCIQLSIALKAAARDGDATPGKTSKYGSKYELRFQMTGPRGTCTILSVWMISAGELLPRLITAFVE